MVRLLLFLLLVPLLVAGSPQPPGPVLGQPGPWDQDVLVHRVSKGGAVDILATFERSGARGR